MRYLTKYCKHGHKYCEHPNCFLNEQQKERVGYLDIETNGLNANFHIMLSYAIKEGGSKKIYGRTITQKEKMSKTIDKKIIQECVRDMLKFDRIITYYGTRFDIPFLRTRALRWNITEFPLYGLVKHTDAYYIAKYKLKLHSYRLGAVTRILDIKGKDFVDGDYWISGALQGDPKAMKYIWEHNKKDVVILEKAYKKLEGYTLTNRRSL